MPANPPTTKPFSISLAPSKSSPSSSSKPPIKPPTFSLTSKSTTKPTSKPPSSTNGLKRPASSLRLHDDHSSDEDEHPPQHESVTGFSSTGAIVSSPAASKKQLLVIPKQANRDWREESRRKRGGGVLPAEVVAQRNGTGLVPTDVVERSEVSKVGGLTFAAPSSSSTAPDAAPAPQDQAQNGEEKATEKMIDELALSALTSTEPSSTRNNTLILPPPTSTSATVDPQQQQQQQQRAGLPSDAEAFAQDVASRPEMASLADYAAVPVEDFGAALLRGMGWKEGDVVGKRRHGASGAGSKGQAEGKPRVVARRAAFLGIGAKEMPTEAELTGGGKKPGVGKDAKKGRGEKVFSPVMLRNSRTGEMVTEGELRAKVLAQEKGVDQEEKEGKEGWRGEDRGERGERGAGRREGARDKDRDRDRDREKDKRRGGGGERDEYGSRRRDDRDDRRDYERGKDRDRDRRDRDRDRDRDRYGARDKDRDRDRDRERARRQDR